MNPLRLACLLFVVLSLSSCSWQGAKLWKRSVCEDIADEAERRACLEEAGQSENEYRQDRQEAIGTPD